MDTHKVVRSFVWLLLIAGTFSCTIRNRDVAGEQSALKDTDWALLSLADENIPLLESSRVIYIHFNSGNNKVKGFAGCNSFFGTYEIRGNRLRLTDVGSTRMSCPDMEVENYLLGVLEQVTSYDISDRILTLYNNGNAVVTLQAQTAVDIE